MKKPFAILLTALLFAQLFGSAATAAATDYSRYSGGKHGFGLGLNTVHQTPGCGEAVNFPKYNAIYHAKTKEKKIYLTFDCGYENGHTKKILKTLKKFNVKAIFFVTKPYIQECPGIVKQMKREGHLVGNHTVSHPSLPSCSVSRVKQELKGCASFMKKATGYAMDPYFRPPMGEWSSRVLKIAKDMGYTTVFWSMAFYDYTSYQPGASVIYNQFMKYYHNGAIPLIHAISSSDTKALPSIIRDMQKKGYEFCRLDEIAGFTFAAKIKKKHKSITYRGRDTRPLMKYDCRYPSISKAGKAGKKINASIQKLREMFKRTTKQHYKELFRQTAEDSENSKTAGRGKQNIKVTYNQNGLLSLKIRETVTLPTHTRPVTADHSTVFDLKTGKKASLAKLLGVRSKKQAEKRIKKAFKKMKKKAAKTNNAVKLTELPDSFGYYLNKKGQMRVVICTANSEEAITFAVK